MPAVSSSRPDMTTRDDAVKATGRPSKEGATHAASPPREARDGAPDFADLLKKAGTGQALPATDSGRAIASKRGPAEAAAPCGLREADPLDRKPDDTALDDRPGATAEAEPAHDRHATLRDLLAQWSELAATPTDTSPAGATTGGPIAADAAAAGRNTGGVAVEITTPAGPTATTVADRAFPGAPHQATHAHPTVVMPGQVKAAPVPSLAIGGGAAPSVAPAPTTMSAHIVDRQTHFAPINTLITGSAGGPGRTKAPDDPAKVPAVRSAPPTTAAGKTDPTVALSHSAALRDDPADGKLPISERSIGGAADERSPEHPVRARNDGESRATGTAGTVGATSSGAPSIAAALPTATLQRLAGSILATAGDLAAGSSAAPAPTEGSGAPDRGPVRVLDLELTPADLGLVRVRMRLTGNGIELQIAAARPATTEHLQQDRHRLSSIIESAGYDIDSLTVQASGDGFRSHILPTIRQDATPNPAQAGGTFQPQADAGTHSDNSRGDQSHHSSPQSHVKENNGSPVQEGERSRPGSLYV